MSDRSSPRAGTAGELRRAFDESFTRAQAAPDTEPTRTFLAIRAGGTACAVRLSEVRGLESGRRIVAVPSAAPELAGLAGVRGKVVAVYNLARLLGGAGPAQGCRWLLLCGDNGELGLTFEELDGAFDAAPDELMGGAPGPSSERPGDTPALAGERASDLVRHGAAILPVLELASMAARILDQAAAHAKER